MTKNSNNQNKAKIQNQTQIQDQSKLQDQQNSATLTFIGFIQSVFKDKFGTPRQPGLAPSARAFIKINPQFQPEISLQGLSGFSHVWLVFWFHKNQSQGFHAKVHPPRAGGKSMGVFATRSPHRPNPLGLSLVKLDEVTQDGLFVSGIDLIDGTPILDIKPYLPQVEALTQALSGWSEESLDENIQVKYSKQCLEQLKLWQNKLGSQQAENSRSKGVNIESLINEILILDPRPLVYRGFEEGPSPYRQEHAVRILDGDIHFKFLNKNTIEVFEIFWPLTNAQSE